MKLLKNPQVTQPNQSQVIKVKSVQSFRDLFRTQFKKLAFVYWIARKAPSKLHVELGPEYPQLWSWWQRHHNNIIHSFLCFYCWLSTNFVYWFSCIFNILQKFMFPLFWTSKCHLEGYEQFKNINVWFLPPIPDSPPPIILEGRNLKIWQNFLGSEFFLTLVGEINLYVGSKNYLGWGRGAGGCNICYYTFII